MKVKPKFKVGDKVRIVKYGHVVNGKDVLPGIVGTKGVINDVSTEQGIIEYALVGVLGASAWYDEEQLEKIK